VSEKIETTRRDAEGAQSAKPRGPGFLFTKAKSALTGSKEPQPARESAARAEPPAELPALHIEPSRAAEETARARVMPPPSLELSQAESILLPLSEVLDTLRNLEHALATSVPDDKNAKHSGAFRRKLREAREAAERAEGELHSVAASRANLTRSVPSMSELQQSIRAIEETDRGYLEMNYRLKWAIRSALNAILVVKNLVQEAGP